VPSVTGLRMSGLMRWSIVVGALLAASTGQAESWPQHLIKATIPFGAGSAADVVPRVVFDRLAAELGQAIVVENRPGAGGTIGTAAVVKSDPDGYNILSQSSALAIYPAIYPDLPFDAAKDLSSVLMMGVTANIMIVPASRPWKTVQDFIADARTKPGSFAFGSAGVGSATISAPKNSDSLPASRLSTRRTAEAPKCSPTFSVAGLISISARSRPRFR